MCDFKLGVYRTRQVSDPLRPYPSNTNNFREHLYRCHRMAIHCDRCWQVFNGQEQLYEHRRAVRICSLQPENQPEGISPEIETKLRSRKKLIPKDTTTTEAEKWKEIYKLLFPQDVVPSPCKTVLRSRKVRI